MAWSFFVPLLLGGSIPTHAQDAHVGDLPHLKASTDLVRVDVVVVDRDGKTVPDLTAADFELQQDGTLQAITVVAFVRPVGTDRVNASTTPPAPAPPSQPSPTKPTSVAPPVYRTVAIVVDDLGLSFTSVDPTQKALRRFIDEQRQPDDLVAIIRTGQSQGTLQQYTRDPKRLHAAVDAIRWNAFGRANIDGLASVEIDPLVRIRPSQSGPPPAFEPGESPDRKREVHAALGSFGALQAVVDGAGTLPGRKSIVFISEGVQPFDQGAEPNVGLEEALRQVIRHAARANVVVHTIDPRGLMTGMLSASDSVSGFSAQTFEHAAAGRFETLQDQQNSLYRLAAETGGRAVVNSNDMEGGLRLALDDQNGYYLIGFVPPSDILNHANHFYRLKVRVKRPGVNVRARPGFYGGSVSLDHGSQLATLFSPVEAATIGLRLTAVLGRAESGEAVVRLLLHIDAKDLVFAEAGEWRTANFAVIGRTLGTNGEVVDASGWRYVFKTRDADYQRALAAGLLYRNQIVVKRPGSCRISVTVRDRDSGAVGTSSQFIDVPDLASGAFALSGLLLSGEQRAAPGSSVQPDETPRSPDDAVAALAGPAVRVFAPGMRLTYALEAYNVPPSSRGPGTLPVVVELRLLHQGKEVLSRPAGHMTPPTRGTVAVWGALDLPVALLAGDYVLEARAALLDPATADVHVVTQSTDFSVRAVANRPQ